MNILEGLKNLVKKVYGKIPKDPSGTEDILKEINERFGSRDNYRYLDLITAIVNKANSKQMGGLNQDGNTESNKPLDINSIGDRHKLIKEIFQDSDISGLVTDLFQRRNRYSSYRSIVKKISRLKRSLEVITNNIIVGDNLMNSNDFIINTNSLIDLSSKDKDYIISTIKSYLDYFKIVDIRKDIIYNTLKYGDFFVEILNNENMFETILMESETIKSNIEIPISKKFKINGVSVKVNLKKHKASKKIILESDAVKNNINSFFSGIEDILQDIDDTNEDKQKTDLLNISLQLHKAENVIKLSIGDERIGYLIVPPTLFFNYGNSPFSQYNIMQFPGIVDTPNANKQIALNVQTITKDLTEKISKFLDKEIVEGLVSENPELKQTIVKFILSGLQQNISVDEFSNLEGVKNLVLNDLNFRFVPYNMMQEFTINVDDYDPYGTSILDEVLFDSKLLLTNKLSATILRLTRSVERRIIEFEINDRDSVSAAEVLKEKFKKARMMFNDEASVDTIPVLLSPFQDYFLPIKNGQRFVNVSYEEPASSIPTSNDDIKFLRDEIVSNFNIPPAYLGLEENIESKATLFLQNIVFAISILEYKKLFAKMFTSLVNKLLEITGKTDFVNKFKIEFNVPIILSTSSELEYLSTISGIWDFLSEQLKIDKQKLVERYLPQFLDLINEDSKIDAKLVQIKNKKLGKENSEEESEAGFGSFGGAAGGAEEEAFKF